MTEPVSDIKVGLKIWKYFGIMRAKWDALNAAADNVAYLQARVAALEKRLDRCPGKGCPHCGALAFRVESSQPDLNLPMLQVRQMKCEQCNFAEQWVVRPSEDKSKLHSK